MRWHDINHYLPVRTLILIVGTSLLVGCAASGSNPNAQGDGSLAGRIKACRSGDTIVSSAANCLADDAACYQLANGSWCTGTRADSCPAGSSELATGSPCPSGARCFDHSESRRCAIQFN